MVADLFFVSLEARSLSFPYCSQSLSSSRFRLPPLPSHTFPLSAAKPKFTCQFVSRCSNSTSDSVSGDLDIISVNEGPDGSVFFRFGNVREMAITESEQSQLTNESVKVVAKVSGKVSDKEDESSINAVDVSDGEGDVGEAVTKKVGLNLKVKIQPRRKPRRDTTRVVDVVKEETASHVINNDRETEKNSVDSSKNVHSKEGSVGLNYVAKVENDSAPVVDGEGISKTEGTTLNMVTKIDLVPDEEKVSPPLPDSAVESEFTTQLDSSESESKIEPQAIKFKEGISGVSEGNGENVGEIDVTTLNTDPKMELAVEVCAQEATAESNIGSEITTQLDSSGSESKIEVPQAIESKEENSSVSERNGENVGNTDVTALITDPKMELAVKEDCAQGATLENNIASEITTQSTSLGACSEMDVPHSLKLQGSGQHEASEEVVHSKEHGEEQSIWGSKKSLIIEDADAGDVGEVKLNSTSSEVESSFIKATEHKTVDEAVEVTHEVKIQNEIPTESTSLGARSEMDVRHGLKYQESAEDDDAGDEVGHLSVCSEEHRGEHSINEAKKLLMVEDADEGDVGEVKLNSTLSEAESILNEATVNKTADESIDSDIAKSSKMSDQGVALSSLNEEITGNKVRVPMLKSADLQSGGTTLEREEISTAGFFLYSGAALLPNPNKAFAGGEDAYFIDSLNWLGVADGVGRWSLEGTSVGLYAKELMENCEKIVSDRNGVPITDPVEALDRSAANAQSCGSCTALVAYFDDWALHVANIGDSGFMIIRNGAVFKRSSPVVYEFNFPLQIERGDRPSDLAEVYRIELNEGDVIITATDGLFDNLYERDIASIVLKSLQESLRPQEIAELLAAGAQEVGQSSSVRSPFADEAQAAGYVGYRGGKLDDVTVIVSLVKRLFSNHI